jgi:hypothetical protein
VAQLEPATQSSVDLIELDVVALDRRINPSRVSGRTIFRSKRTAVSVDVKTFAHHRPGVVWQRRTQQSWLAALGAEARANVSVYSVDPTGLSRGSGARGMGLVALTGGELFANSNDFVRAANAIWREVSRHYLLGYWPSTGARELHTISVTVTPKGLHLRVRRRRGS